MTRPNTPRFVLPGKWGRVNLENDATTARSIRRILDDITRRRDDLVIPRAEMRKRFELAAATAREGGATDLYLGLELVPSVPLPAWVSVFVPPAESVNLDALGLDAITAFLDQGMTTWGDPSAVRRPTEVGPDDAIHAVRHSWRRIADVVEGDIEHRFEFVEADYWLAAREPNRIALITFSTALAEYEEEMLLLFDAVVSTVRWPAETREEASA